MKKFFFLATLSLLITTFTTAQSLQIKNTMGFNINHGDTFVVYQADLHKPINQIFWVENTASESIRFLAKKTELSLVSNTINYYCWGSCYGPNVYESKDTLTFGAGELSKTAFAADYEAEGHEGVTYIGYTFWDINNPSDSTYLVVQFRVGSAEVSIEDNNIKEAKVSDAYPNPAKNEFFVDYTFENANYASIEILNVVGTKVSTQELDIFNNKAKIDVADLRSGVYFYNIYVDGQKITSKKLIIQK